MRDPSFTILYGDLKAGKTAAVLAAFPTAAYVAAPGALSPAAAVWDFPEPPRNDLKTFRDCREFGKSLDASKCPALVIDDATLIADRTAIYFESEKHLSGFDLWRAVLFSAIKMRDELRRKGIHVILTCHPGGAYVENGVRRKGGPAFQGQARQKLPAAADLLLRAEERNGAGFGWGYVYRTAPHPDWLQGSRYNTPDSVPANLREVLVAAGFTLPRLRGLEWQDKAAAAVANQLTKEVLGDYEQTKGVILKARDFLIGKFKNVAHVDWALQDGYAKAVMKIAQAAQSNSMWGG